LDQKSIEILQDQHLPDLEDGVGQRHTAKILATLIQHSDLAAGASFSGMVQAGSGGQYQPNPKEQHSAVDGSCLKTGPQLQAKSP